MTPMHNRHILLFFIFDSRVFSGKFNRKKVVLGKETGINLRFSFNVHIIFYVIVIDDHFSKMYLTSYEYGLLMILQ